MSTGSETIDYRGSPEQVGAQLFSDALGPTIEAAGTSDVTPQQLARMLAGMLAALTGTVADNFGPEAAMDMLRGTANLLESSAGEINTH